MYRGANHSCPSPSLLDVVSFGNFEHKGSFIRSEVIFYLIVNKVHDFTVGAGDLCAHPIYIYRKS